MKNKFAFKLTLQIIAVILLICISLTLLTYNRVHNMMLEEIKSQMVNRVVSASNYFYISLQEKTSLLEAMARTAEIKSMNWEVQEPYVEAEITSLNTMRIQVSDSKGQTRIPGGQPFDLSDKPNFIATVENKETVVTPPLNSSADNKRIVILTTPILGRTDRVDGVLGFVYDASFLTELVEDYYIDDNNYAFIVADNGNILAHHNADYIANNTNYTDLYQDDAKHAAFLTTMEDIKTGSTDFQTNYLDNEDKLIAYSPIKGTSWRMVLVHSEAESLQSVISLRNIMIGLMGLFIVIGLIVAFFISNSVKKPLQKVAEFAKHLSDGDFTFRINDNRTDEFGDITKALNHMAKQTSGLMKNVVHSVDSVVTSSDVMSKVTDEASTVSEEVSKSMEEMASAVSSQSQEIVSGSQAVDALSQKLDVLFGNMQAIDSESITANSETQSGHQAIASLVDKTKQTNDQVNKISTVISDVNNSIQSINTITDAIGAIADQTNLLALNAAIESARAGEAGKGFAVVSEEIRKLAEQSANAAKEIQSIIANIKNQSEDAVNTMSETGELFNQQSHAVYTVGEKFELLSKHINKTIELVQTSSSINSEINSDKDKLMNMLSSVASMAEQSAAAIEEVSAASVEQSSGINELAKQSVDMAELSKDVKQKINQFKI